ncbi:hypothetical protein QWZ14_30595 [Paeniroseomonas aquatica]|uniref:Uncharacterized protein n=2 Tax=Paeniroseomonas aquatica TaxID=373043 RepID=A0ABT8AG02_9PROT|nr:hypothetical protein [Paeniroseomonas aquatica]MDN3568747.1 hypothetical protein [Paeniroseomonas aquatica]
MPTRSTLAAIAAVAGLLSNCTTMLTDGPGAVRTVWEATTTIAEVAQDTSVRTARIVGVGIDAAAARWRIEHAVSAAQQLAAASTDYDPYPPAPAAGQQPALLLLWPSGESLLRLRLDDLWLR